MFFPAPCIFLSILCAGLCIPGPSSYKSIHMVYTERRVRVSCSVYDMLHTDVECYIIMCKLVKLACCLCCEPIDPSNMGVHISTTVARGANTQLDPSCVYQRLQRLTWIYSKYIVHALLLYTSIGICAYAVLCRPNVLHIPFLLKYLDELSLCVRN